MKLAREIPPRVSTDGFMYVHCLAHAERIKDMRTAKLRLMETLHFPRHTYAIHIVCRRKIKLRETCTVSKLRRMHSKRSELQYSNVANRWDYEMDVKSISLMRNPATGPAMSSS